MNILAIASGLLALTCFSLAAFIYKNTRSPLHRLWTYFNICVGIWGAGILFASLTSDPKVAFRNWQIAHCGGFFVSVFFYHVIHNFCNLKNKFFLFLVYGQAILFFVLNLFGLAGYEVHLTFDTIYYVKAANIIYVFVTFFWFLPVIYGHVVLFLSFREATGERRKQMKYLFASMLVGFSGGAQHFLPVYNINIYPYGNFLITIYTLIATYAIFRHRLLEIDVIVRKTLVFAGLTAFVFGVFSAATFIVREVLSVYLGASNLWTYVISIFLIVLGYDPIRNLLINVTDRFLFQKKYDYQKLLKDATKGISKIESLNHLFGLVTHFITMRMRVVNAAILTKIEEENRFSLEYQRGYSQNYLTYYVNVDAPMIQHLAVEKEPIDLEKVNEQIQVQSTARKNEADMQEYDYRVIKQQMEELEAAVCIPSFLGDELRNVLVIGPKKSGGYYSEDDLNVLFTLAQESAIAIENARLYDEAIKKTHELEKINEQLEGAKSQLTEALRETEAANKQLQDTQAQLIHEQKMATLGRLAASVGHEVNNPLTILSMNVSRAVLKYRKNPDLKVTDILDVFQKMEQNISRIKAVVNTLTGLLKKSEKGKFEPLSLKLILEETLPLVQFQTYLDNLAGTEVEFNIPANLPLIRGDLERLQEVFLNLFINAYHAMSGRRNPRITVTADAMPENPGMIAVNFRDNGKGMDEETVKKIFNYGFTTKPPGKGSGLGLYMCKYIIELHGGDIKVQSTPGVGTTFLLTIPAFTEEGLAGGTPQAEMG